MSRRPHTIAEKILATKSGKAEVSPGEIVEAKVDVAMAHEALAAAYVNEDRATFPVSSTRARSLWSR